MRVFSASGCNDAFVQACHELSRNPEFAVSPRGKKTREITNAVIEIADPYDRLVRHPDRGLSLRYLVGEFLWYERASDRLAEIQHYSSFWKACSDDGESVRSSYGHRLLGGGGGPEQWSIVRDELRADPNSRRAVLSILRADDLRDGVRDVPCTVGLQFLIRENRLNLTAIMRSNDLYLGFCYDAAVFTLWQEKMLVTLQGTFPELRMGTYTHFATSLHVYEQHFGAIERVAVSPALTLDDPRFAMPRLNDPASIEMVQPLEARLRSEGRNVLRPVRLGIPFADWLVDCLHAG